MRPNKLLIYWWLHSIYLTDDTGSVCTVVMSYHPSYLFTPNYREKNSGRHAWKKNVWFLRSIWVNLLIHFVLFIFRFRCLFNWILVAFFVSILLYNSMQITKRSHGCHRTVVGFTTTWVISAYHNWSCEVESRSGEVQH